MLPVEIICIGKMKNDALLPVWENYARRLLGKLTLTELEGKSQKDEWDKISQRLNPQAALIVLDETGKSLGSRNFAQKIEEIQNSGAASLQFVIGGADGLSDDIRRQARLVLAFGQQTWPHLLARVMLLEQIYRTQQILAGHPYHRD